MRTIHVLRKPCSEPTVAANVLRYGTGGINVDGCRVGLDVIKTTGHKGDKYAAFRGGAFGALGESFTAEHVGRWPANVIHDGSEGVVSTFPDTGTSTGGRIGNASGAYVNQGRTGWGMGHEAGDPGFGDAGSASRYFQRVNVKGAGGSEARDLIEYLRTMITPPDENLPPTPEGEPSKAVFLHVEDPEAFDWSAYADQSVHAMVAASPAPSASSEAWISEAYRVLKPGAHLLLVAPEDEVTGHTGACVAEDLGFEVRDAILLLTGDSVGQFHYTAKSGRSEREAGLFDSEFDYGQQDEGRKEGNPGGDNPRNRGLTKRKNVHPCLHPDALVLTVNGFRPIRDVRIGDLVYGANGRFNSVEHVSHHPYTSPDLFEIHVAGTNYTTPASDNHPFLIWRPTRKGKSVTGGNVLWVPAEEVQPGDYTMTPVYQDISLPEGAEEDTGALDLDGWFLFGLYLADGVAHRSGHGTSVYPSFTVSDAKPHLIERIQAFGAARGFNVGVYEKKGTKAKQVVVFDPEAGSLFTDLGGRGAGEKRLGVAALQAPRPVACAILDGYLAGDGASVRKHKQAKTVSPDLASHIALLGERAGYRASLYRYEGVTDGKGIGDRKFKNVRDVYQVYLSDQNRGMTGRKPSRPSTVEHEGVTFTLRLVQQVVRVPYTGDVWNLSVATSPTFQTAVGMSHNTVKPVEIMEFCLRDVPKDVGPVLDPFLGSGTTLLACIETGHDGIGIEREEEYAQIADARIRHRDYETAGWNRAEFISPFSKGDEAEAPAALPPKEISLDDFFGVGD